eukprot:CFRG6399T1
MLCCLVCLQSYLIMSDVRIQRLEAANERLRQELELPRIKVSEASEQLKKFCSETKDPLVPSVWGKLDDKENPYAKKSGGTCVLL